MVVDTVADMDAGNHPRQATRPLRLQRGLFPQRSKKPQRSADSLFEAARKNFGHSRLRPAMRSIISGCRSTPGNDMPMDTHQSRRLTKRATFGEKAKE
jgi:hypothetical protein